MEGEGGEEAQELQLFKSIGALYDAARATLAELHALCGEQLEGSPLLSLVKQLEELHSREAAVLEAAQQAAVQQHRVSTALMAVLGMQPDGDCTGGGGGSSAAYASAAATRAAAQDPAAAAAGEGGEEGAPPPAKAAQTVKKRGRDERGASNSN